ncbi:MAG TPA: hypothetical protein VE173_10385, partial [Longimicrobiales bacterium]|nr:hypothetical protein [Longimicrobiales bacterium]
MFHDPVSLRRPARASSFSRRILPMNPRSRISPSLLVLALALLPAPGALRAQTTGLEVGQVRSGSLSTGDTLRYTFQAGDDFLFYGEVAQISVDVVVTLVNADGQ